MHLQVRSCRNPDCPRHRICLRPEQEGHFALPQHELVFCSRTIISAWEPRDGGVDKIWRASGQD